MNTDDLFYFKADRNYIHSSNIFTFILTRLETNQPKNIDFKLAHITQNICDLETDKVKAENGRILGQYKDDSALYFIMESDTTVTDRRPFDEKGLVRKCEIEEDKIAVPDGISKYSFIEKVNAAFKALLSQSVFPDSPTKYLFVRLIAKHIPTDGFMIHFKRMIGGRFCEGSIMEHNDAIGHIYFSMEENS